MSITDIFPYSLTFYVRHTCMKLRYPQIVSIFPWSDPSIIVSETLFEFDYQSTCWKGNFMLAFSIVWLVGYSLGPSVVIIF